MPRNIDNHGNMRAQRRRGFALACLVIAISCAIAVLIGEAIVRVFYPQELGNWTYTRDGLTLHLSDMRQFSTRFGHQINTNSAGMRDREHNLQKGSGVFRILVLGDSFMEANQVKFEDSFASLLEHQLTEGSGRSVEVINAGVSGWGTDDELTYLTRRGVRYKPDLIIVAMTLHNDVSDNLLEEFHTFRNGQLEERPATLVPWRSLVLLRVKEWLASHSHLYQIFLRAVRSNWVSIQAQELDADLGNMLRRASNPRMTMGWEMTGKLFEKIVKVAGENNAKSIVVLLPLLVQVYPEELPRLLSSNNLRNEDVEIEKPQQIMKTIGKAVGLPVIDLLPTFSEEKRRCCGALFLKGDGHWNEQGHLTAASEVAKRILGSALIPSQ